MKIPYFSLCDTAVPNLGTVIILQLALQVSFLQGKVAKWWIPEDVVFVNEIPHTAAGKIYKLQLRKQFKDYKFPNSKL